MGLIIVNKEDKDLAWNDSSKTWEKEDYDTFTDQTDIPLPPDGEWEVVPWSKQS